MQPDLFTEPAPRDPRYERDIGMERAVDHADRVVGEWSDRALALIVEYAKRHAEFAIEDVRLRAESEGFPAPPHKRAWGSPTRKAVVAGVLEKTGRMRSSTDPAGHVQNKALWSSRLIGRR